MAITDSISSYESFIFTEKLVNLIDSLVKNVTVSNVESSKLIIHLIMFAA